MSNTTATARPPALAAYDFHAGTDTRAYETFGAHRQEDGTYLFRLYAPRARAVSLLGDFLPDGSMPMQAMGQGVWACVAVAEVPPEGMAYAFLLDGRRRIADPFGRQGLWGEAFGSLVTLPTCHRWQDGMWCRHRAALLRHADTEGHGVPLNAYEVHLGSFATRGGRSNVGGDAYLNYRELGEMLARYLRELNYTHVHLLPLTEHRRDTSHGYAPLGLFAPTGRHGTPDDLRAMVDCLHRAGIGVLMDLPLSSLGEEALPPDPRRPEVRSYLLSAVFYWLREFHLDGLCLRGLSRLFGAGAQTAASAEPLLRLLCAAVHAELPEALLMAGEEVGEMTRGGMGFDLLCHRAFAGDLLTYLGAAPDRRQYLGDRLRLLCRRAAEERYLLPLSHEAVSAARASLFGQMWGSYGERFAALRLLLAFQMALPGKKQLFMGSELGQVRPWDDTVPPDFYLRELAPHAALMRYVRALNGFYRDEPRLWQWDSLPTAPRARAESGAGDCLFALARYDGMGRELLALFNFSAERLDCRCETAAGTDAYREVFHTDRVGFGGEGRLSAGALFPVQAGEVRLTLPPMTAVFCEPVPAG
ncbi:MAG: alpha amylase C-terminal domain-containing protein [Clostridia bacterium]|nr:alpha amylase C-terminal domain-containing protein [Clostridia bacterium]